MGDVQLDKISVIVPVYGVEQYLDACIQSIAEQTYENLEIILVDDGSRDRCPEICDTWAKKDARIRVIHKENGGLSSARNAGLAVATGEYIGFVDSDDYIHPRMYEILLEAMKENDVKMASCLSTPVKADGELPDIAKNADVTVLSVDQMLDGIFRKQIGTSVWRKLYEKSIFEHIRFPEGEINEDYPLIVPIARESGGMVWVKQVLYGYRTRPGSITNSGMMSRSPDILLKNFQRIQQQLEAYKGKIPGSYRFFVAANAYSVVLSVKKGKQPLNETGKLCFEEYVRLMRKYGVHYLCSPYSSLKDKILYICCLLDLIDTTQRVKAWIKA